MKDTPRGIHPKPAADPVRKAVELLQDPQRLRSSLDRAWRAWNPLIEDPVLSARILRVHYRPFAAARLVLELAVRSVDPQADPLRQFVYLQVYPEEESALHRRAAYLQKPVLPSAGPPVFVVEEANAVAFSLPNGPRLRKLATFLDPELFLRLLRLKGLDGYAEHYRPGLLELVRYVPRKRVLLRIPSPAPELPGLYIKAFGKADFPSALARQQGVLAALRAGRLAFDVPALRARSSKRRALFLAELPGERLTSSFAAGAEEVWERVGTALASLHRSPSGLAEDAWAPEVEFQALQRGSQDLCLALPDLAPKLQALAKELEQRLGEVESYEAVPIHANLFGDQILVASDQVGIVDWDDLTLGDPCFDIGRLLAHMAYAEGCHEPGEGTMAAESRSLLRGYSSAGGPELDRRRLAWHFAAAVILRGKISALRTLGPEWPAAVARSAGLATRVLGDGLERWLDG